MRWIWRKYSCVVAACKKKCRKVQKSTKKCRKVPKSAEKCRLFAKVPTNTAQYSTQCVVECRMARGNNQSRRKKSRPAEKISLAIWQEDIPLPILPFDIKYQAISSSIKYEDIILLLLPFDIQYEAKSSSFLPYQVWSYPSSTTSLWYQRWGHILFFIIPSNIKYTWIHPPSYHYLLIWIFPSYTPWPPENAISDGCTTLDGMVPG